MTTSDKVTGVSSLNLESVINDVLSSIEREREREVVSRRFGLFDRKETLEQIGELLGITRERVRQLEKAIEPDKITLEEATALLAKAKPAKKRIVKRRKTK